MRLQWGVTPSDIAEVKRVVGLNLKSPLVQERVRRNVRGRHPSASKSSVWAWLVYYLLTTQQRSGPNFPVTRFTRARPFPLGLAALRSTARSEALVRRVLTEFGGIRRAPTIAKQLSANFHTLEDGLWDEVLGRLRSLEKRHAPAEERLVAKCIAGHLDGFGPKQSRNLIQQPGLSRHEIPIDSRITRWLNEHIWPIPLDAQMLGSHAYYDWVMDGVQQLCRRAGGLPCVFNAAVFSSLEPEGE